MSLRSAPPCVFLAFIQCIHYTRLRSEAYDLGSIQKEVANMLDMCLDSQINTYLYDWHLAHAA